MSKPLRAIGLVMTGWIAMRATILLWPEQAMDRPSAVPDGKAQAEQAHVASRPVAGSYGEAPFTEPISAQLKSHARESAHLVRRRPINARIPETSVPPVASPSAVEVAQPLGFAAMVETPEPQRVTITDYGAPQKATAKNVARLSGSAWTLIRNGSGAIAGAPQLGGSQTGFRLFLPLNDIISLTSRASAALSQPGKEATVGVSVRPAHGAFQIIAERRIRIDKGGRNAFSLTAASGFTDKRIGPNLKAEGYVQAGFVGLRNTDSFLDGALRVHHDGRLSRSGLKPGIGAWISAQPGSRRLDAGPSVQFRLGSIRADLDWRIRLAGNARPTTGPALAISTDF